MTKKLDKSVFRFLEEESMAFRMSHQDDYGCDMRPTELIGDYDDDLYRHCNSPDYSRY